jgi:hypothetical protein
MTELTVIYREGCHLCDVMLAQLAALQVELGFRVRPVDVDSDADLVEDYGVLVPVLLLEEREICHYHLDEAALRQALADGGHPVA